MIAGSPQMNKPIRKIGKQAAAADSGTHNVVVIHRKTICTNAGVSLGRWLSSEILFGCLIKHSIDHRQHVATYVGIEVGISSDIFDYHRYSFSYISL